MHTYPSKEPVYKVLGLEDVLGGWKTVDAALKFLYTAEYPAIPKDEAFSHNVTMYVFADRHGFKTLAQCAKHEFTSNHWLRVQTSERLRKDLYNATGLIERNCSGEDLVWLRRRAMFMMAKCAPYHAQRGNQEAEWFWKVLKSFPPFVAELWSTFPGQEESLADAKRLLLRTLFATMHPVDGDDDTVAEESQ
jgi:hypothetical protein